MIKEAGDTTELLDDKISITLQEYIKGDESANQFLTKILHILDSNLNTSFSFTGDVFEFLVSKAPKGVPEVDKSLKELLNRSTVFARMKPNDKGKLVEELRRLKGEMIAMCGDGANDCNALRAADAGLCLSESEAASISAPFTAKEMHIRPIIDLLLEGRCSLSVNFQCFMYVSIYAIVEGTSSMILYSFVAMFSDGQFLLLDLLISMVLMLAMSFTKPADKLGIDRPPPTLMTPYILTTLVLGWVLELVTQILLMVFLTRQDFYVPSTDYWFEDNTNTECQESTALFLNSAILYIAGAFVSTSLLSQFRKSVWTNYLFVIPVVLQTTYLVIIFFVPLLRFPTLLLVTDDMPTTFLLSVLAIGVGASTLWLLIQRYVITRIGRRTESMKVIRP